MRDFASTYRRFSLLFAVSTLVALCVSSSGATVTAVFAQGRVAAACSLASLAPHREVRIELSAVRPC